MTAMEKELASIKGKDVWDIVPRPKDRSVVGGRWVFRIKPNIDGTIAKYKACYVAKGYSQIPGTDYHENFSPTGKPSSLRILTAIAALNGWEIHSIDAVCAFLNTKLDYEIYLELPENIKSQLRNDSVTCLKKTIYGLKESAKYWNDEVYEFLSSEGFNQSEAGPCVYVRISPCGRKFSALYVHMDNMGITGNEISEITERISSRWVMEDLGILHCIVGIHISRTSEFSYAIGQPAMINSVLERFDMSNCKPASTPMPPDSKLVRATDAEAADFARQELPYQSGVGSLMYLSQCSRPDIAYAVGVLSQHLESPSRVHWNTFIHVLRYFHGTTNLFIEYKNLKDDLVGNQSWTSPLGFSDANWAGNWDNRRSTTGYIFKFLGGAVSWKSRLHPTVALSSTESEYRATTKAGQEATWLQNLLRSFGLEMEHPTELHCDNLGAIQLSSKTIFHA